MKTHLIVEGTLEEIADAVALLKGMREAVPEDDGRHGKPEIEPEHPVVPARHGSGGSRPHGVQAEARKRALRVMCDHNAVLLRELNDAINGETFKASSGALWIVLVNGLMVDYPDVFQYYKDTTVKYHRKGFRWNNPALGASIKVTQGNLKQLSSFLPVGLVAELEGALNAFPFGIGGEKRE